ncbi:hypothetical protein [Saccharothrix syringae]|uniref:Uncharacterized protein n=1 Tax=Saccharothrix syringae TaxID=103733 RepID=A0A5Q0HCF4_SACSY|nr:hypothetical protein [Saccharothrix syringae]QFZ23644.1 hypothetical protein EKG83_44965 [Saccharothrix syringae]
MTEPVPERASADAAAGAPPTAGPHAAGQRAAEQPSAPPEPGSDDRADTERDDRGGAGAGTEPPPGTTGAAQAAPVEQPPTGGRPTGERQAGERPAGEQPGEQPTGEQPGFDFAAFAQAAAAGNPRDAVGSLSLAAIEADIDRLMTEKMSELDGMLAGLEELVERLEGEITQLEPPTDDNPTP